jgi:hypothetical protein
LSPLGLLWAAGESLREQIAFDIWRKQLLVADHPTLIFAVYDQLWLFTLLGVGTLILELGAPLAAISGWVALIWVPSTYLMHQGIEMLMGITFPYQLSGVAFAPFVPWSRLLGWGIGIGRRIFRPSAQPEVRRADASPGDDGRAPGEVPAT